MSLTRKGGAGKVWPDSNISFLSKRVAYNGENSVIDVDRIVALKRTDNGSAYSAYLANSSDPTHQAGIWGIAKGGLGTARGETKGIVVDWALLNLNTSASSLDAPVYVDAAAPGVLTLTAGALSVPVGRVIRIGASSTDTRGTIAVAPQEYRAINGVRGIVPDVASGATFSAAALAASSGGVIQMTSSGSETRNLPSPSYMGQTITLTLISANSVAVTAASHINSATNTVMTFNAVGETIRLEALPTNGASALRWRIVFNDGVGLS